MVTRFAILDGYVDEPSCLGVPPYVSPYPRYIAGALDDANVEWRYITIDQYRSGAEIPDLEDLIIVGGALVPGKYLRGMPASTNEIARIAGQFRGKVYVAGPIARFWDRKIEVGPEEFIRQDADAFVYDLAKTGKGNDRRRIQEEWERWAEIGATLIKHHPDFPVPLIAEIEIMRSCVRYFMGGCSFCTDVLYGEPQFRSERSIVNEVQRMRALGLERFRLGAISCTFTYMAKGIGETETPTPDPKAWARVLKGTCNPMKPKVLHTDNANPAVMRAHPVETGKILKLLVEHCTPGNVLSLGMESADKAVIEANRLNATPDDVLEAIRMINKAGRARGDNGMPLLLPGLNFVTGLDGESKDTFRKNMEFLEKVVEERLWLRRINIREVAPWRRDFRPRHRVEARRFKQKVREQIDRRMLMDIVPTGTVMGEVYLECVIGNVTFGRQIGTYPLLVGIPEKLPLDRFVDAIVASHGERSVTALEHPIRINRISMRALAAIPGIGKKRAASIVRARPFRDGRALAHTIEDCGEAIRFLNENTAFD